MYSNIAVDNSTRVFHRRRLSNSICTEDQNDSIIALSYPSPTVPNDGSRPALRIFSPGPYPRILDTGCDYAAGRSVAV